MSPSHSPSSPPTTSTLTEAVDAVAALAAAAGGDAGVAREEALALAAAVAESAPRAAADWGAAAGGATAQDFFDAASRGRRWREAPTATLSALAAQRSPHTRAYAEALAEVAVGRLRARRADHARHRQRVRRGGRAAVRRAPCRRRRGGAGRGPRRDTGAGVASAPARGLPGEPGAAAVPAQPIKSLDELLAELDALIGLQRVKREIHRQVALLRVEKLRVDAGLKSPTLTRHLVFTGNPGTGKTTVARLVGGIYQALGLLSRGHLVEVDRSELVAGYLGQTATKTADVVASAAGGVLFIDEAYSLTGGGRGGDQYGQESVDTLVKEMEDRRDDLVVIVAGYPAPMAAFIAANPGLASRFRTTIDFEDYTDDELVAILEHLASGADYELEREAVERFREVLGRTPRGAALRQRPLRPQRPRGGYRPPRLAAARDGRADHRAAPSPRGPRLRRGTTRGGSRDARSRVQRGDATGQPTPGDRTPDAGGTS